jgi:hypothetical protein
METSTAPINDTRELATKPANRRIEASQRSHNQQSSSLACLQLTNSQAQLIFLKIRPSLNHVGQLMHSVDRAPIAIPRPKQKNARRVGEYRWGGDERQYCEWIGREIHLQRSSRTSALLYAERFDHQPSHDSA